MIAENYKWGATDDGNIQLVNVETADYDSVEQPEIVYKYRCWHNSKSPFHDNILLNNEIYIPSPSEFFDKKDCSNPTRYDILNHDERVVLCQRILRNKHPRYNEDAILRLAKSYAESPRLQDKAWMEEVDRRNWNDYNKFTGVFSVTDNELNPDLWGAYGDNFKGICYGFDTKLITQDVGFKAGGLVSYVEELPVIHPFDEFPKMFFKRVFCKTKEWEFEQEYRLMTNDYLPRTRPFRESTLREVIIGHNMPEKYVNEIIMHLGQRQTGVKLFQTEPIKNFLSRKEIVVKSTKNLAKQ